MQRKGEEALHKNQKNMVYKISKHRIDIYMTVFKLLMQKIIEWLFGLKYVLDGRTTLLFNGGRKNLTLCLLLLTRNQF